MRSSTSPPGVMAMSHHLIARHDAHAARGEGWRAVARAFVEDGKAETEIAAFRPGRRLAQPEGRDIEPRDGIVQRLDIAGLVQHQAGGRAMGKAFMIAPADLVRRQADACGGTVHQPLDAEGDRRTRHAAIRRHWTGARLRTPRARAA